ncbi:O-antigen ligase family protein, partial [Chlamydiota bacterium]
FMLIPLPKIFFKLLSPYTFSVYKQYIPGYNSDSSFFPLKTLTISSYDTLINVMVLFIYFFFFLFCLGYKKTSIDNKKLLQFTTVIAMIIAFWGLINFYVQNDKLFWFINIISGIPIGPFVNTIHFGAFMALFIPLVLGFWLASFDHRYFIPLFIMMLGLFKSLSRGAMIALFVSIVIFMLLLFLRKETRKRAFILITVFLVGLLFIIVIDDGTITKRLITMVTPFSEDSVITRLQLSRDTLKIVKDFPLFGTGLGTFSIIFPGYKTLFGSGKMFFTHAENEYSELLSEIGIIGFVILIVIVLIISKIIFKSFYEIAKRLF